MKKTIAIVILAAFILATFPSIVSAWNPPGMFVREDDRLEDTPWSDLSSLDPNNDGPDTNQIQKIDTAVQESEDFTNNILIIISLTIYIKAVVHGYIKVAE